MTAAISTEPSSACSLQARARCWGNRQIKLLCDESLDHVAGEHESIKCPLVLDHGVRCAGSEAGSHVAELARTIIGQCVSQANRFLRSPVPDGPYVHPIDVRIADRAEPGPSRLTPVLCPNAGR